MQNVFAFLSGSTEPLESRTETSLWRVALSSMLSNPRGVNETALSLDQLHPALSPLSEVDLDSDPTRRLLQLHAALCEHQRAHRDYLESAMSRTARADDEAIETMVSAAYELLKYRSEGNFSFPGIRNVGEWDAARIGMESCRLVIVYIIPGEELNHTEAGAHVRIARRFQKPVLLIAPNIAQHPDWDVVESLEQAAEFTRLMFTSTLRAR